MDEERAWAVAYLAARGDSPWRWADGGKVIAWADGTTISFREEIVYILQWLAPHGWPSFGALVWVLAACRGKLPPPVSFTPPFAGAPPNPAPASERQLMLGEFRHRLVEMHSQVEAGLAGIAQLPAGLRASLKAKAVLAETVFGHSPMEPGQLARLQPALELLRAGVLTDSELNAPGAPPPGGHREWLTLQEGLAQIAPDSLLLRLQTGLDALPQAAKLPEAPAARVRGLLTGLRVDPEHAGLARLARDLMAAIQIPRRLSARDELPLGGFSDLANRGNLDRLLLSELAHDDLTLAVRIALGEALYLRRDPPAAPPPRTLAVLMDSGVRLWGVPRVLATGVALALIGKCAADYENVLVFRASGSEIVATDLLTKPGLVAHLGALEPHAHPGPALAAFRQALAGLSGVEVVLITQRDVLLDPQFRRALALSGLESLFLAVVDRDGSFELSRYPQGGEPLSRARVSVEDLLPFIAAPAPRNRPLLDRRANPDLPLAFSVEPFPLLLPVMGPVQMMVATENGGGLCVMKDRRLLAWERPSRGTTTLANTLPRGHTIWLRQHSDKTICLVKAINGGRQLFCRVFNPEGVSIRSHDWQFSEPVVRVESRGEVLFIIHDRHAHVRSLDSGAELATIPLPPGLSHGRYFRDADEKWRVLTWNGQALQLEEVPLPSPLATSLRLFDRTGFEGPWGVTRRGEVLSPEGRIWMSLGLLSSVQKISDDGSHLLVNKAGSGAAGGAERNVMRVNLETKQTTPLIGAVRDRDWKSTVQPPSRTLHARYDRIAISGSGDICLHSSKSGWWTLSLETTAAMLIDKLGAGQPAGATQVEFQALPAAAWLNFSVKVARWPDGRCAWLDERGLLHLRAADIRLPEISLVLSRDQSAAWSSDGCWFGGEFFIGDHPEGSAAQLSERVHAFSLPLP